MIKVFLLLLGLNIALVAHADNDHSGHSDDLLLLLKDKIELQTLVKNYPSLSEQEQALNSARQRILFKRSLSRLKHYVATPESQYPNMSMYHESLKSRAVLMQGFSALMLDAQCLQDNTCQAH
jgi:hypothetical protein